MWKTALCYTAVSASCAVFGLIYESFSHGVYSNHMLFFFLFPLLGGVLPFLLLAMGSHCYRPGRGVARLYHAGIAALTVGSCVSGVLEIYGTSSDLTAVYWFTGGLLTGLGVLFYLLAWRGDSQE